jgi:hypothetical protein
MQFIRASPQSTSAPASEGTSVHLTGKAFLKYYGILHAPLRPMP